MFIITLVTIIATGVICQTTALDHSPPLSLLSVIAVAAYWVGAAVWSRLAGRLESEHATAAPGSGSSRSAVIARAGHNVWLVFGSAAVVFNGYGYWVFEKTAFLPLVPEVAVMAPYVVAMVCSLLSGYDPYRSTRLAMIARHPAAATMPIWTRRAYVGYHLRTGLLLAAVPIALLTLVLESVALYLQPHVPEWASVVVTLCAVAGVFVGAPVAVVRVLNTHRLPDGPLRTDLQQMARELRVRFRDIRLWKTGGVIVNAAVLGVVGFARYVLLTDAVLARMDSRRIQAIFAHEAGHIRHHHLPFYLLFAITTVLIATLAQFGVDALWGLPDWPGELAAAGVLIVLWAVVFGWISRRFERQSDVTAAWAAACDPSGRVPDTGVAIFSDALQELAILNGRPLNRRSWRHGSIRSRTEYLHRLATEDGTRHSIDRVVRRIKIAVVAALLATLTTMVAMSLGGQAQ